MIGFGSSRNFQLYGRRSFVNAFKIPLWSMILGDWNELAFEDFFSLISGGKTLQNTENDLVS